MHTFHVTPRVPLSNSTRQSSVSAWGGVPPSTDFLKAWMPMHIPALYTERRPDQHSFLQGARRLALMPTHLPSLFHGRIISKYWRGRGGGRGFNSSPELPSFDVPWHPLSKLCEMAAGWIGAPFLSSLPAWVYL